PRGPWPIGAADVGLSTLQLVGGLQEVRSCSIPVVPLFHDIAHASGYGISLDDGFDDRLAICTIGARDPSDRPESGFACGCPERKIRHAGQRCTSYVAAPRKPVCRHVKQGPQDGSPRTLEV